MSGKWFWTPLILHVHLPIILGCAAAWSCNSCRTPASGAGHIESETCPPGEPRCRYPHALTMWALAVAG